MSGAPECVVCRGPVDPGSWNSTVGFQLTFEAYRDDPTSPTGRVAVFRRVPHHRHAACGIPDDYGGDSESVVGLAQKS